MSEKEYFAEDEQQALALAAQDLGIAPELLKYRIVETKKKGIFSKGGVKISVQVGNGVEHTASPLSDEAVQGVLQFIDGLIQRMGLEGKTMVTLNAGDKLNCIIESPDSSIIIGKMGKTLDAIQALATVILQNRSQNKVKLILDCESYRERRQQRLISFAEEVAEQVRRTRSSRLLEPMNPYERRLIHTALTRYSDIETVSEGEGLYKQIRIRYRNQRVNNRFN